MAKIILSAAKRLDKEMFRAGKKAGLEDAAKSAQNGKDAGCAAIDSLYGRNGRRMPGAWMAM